jgi:hypothetical protein
MEFLLFFGGRRSLGRGKGKKRQTKKEMQKVQYFAESLKDAAESIGGKQIAYYN